MVCGCMIMLMRGGFVLIWIIEFIIVKLFVMLFVVFIKVVDLKLDKLLIRFVW